MTLNELTQAKVSYKYAMACNSNHCKKKMVNIGIDMTIWLSVTSTDNFLWKCIL